LVVPSDLLLSLYIYSGSTLRISPMHIGSLTLLPVVAASKVMVTSLFSVV
jgi:hypothetical protein